ncbi:hypothetical protein DFH06DRAFT_993182 [Mycena polygramma]|nr:hypothetical protein DFH06DRAFT_993182 [Mycena polygramma]
MVCFPEKKTLKAPLTPLQLVFQDVNGFPIKFFIQKDLAEDIQAELCETITSLGGRVESKVPRQGFILVDYGSTEEGRLRSCWTSAERPERYFVPYTFVEACKIAGTLLKQIFLENGLPIPMHIHSSIANPNARSALSQRIMHSGGNPDSPAHEARVILADPNTEVFQHLVKTYQGEPDKYIESYLWVKKCVERGAILYTPVVYKNPGGRRPGEEYASAYEHLFTEEDEQNLADWIAIKIPFKETGGRTGNRLYQQLCDLSGEPEYAWVARHTWQSWRERYKKNATRLDALISAIVAQKKPTLGDKGQYGYVRQAEEKQKKQRKSKKKKNASTVEEEFLAGSSKLEGMGVFSVPGLEELPDPDDMGELPLGMVLAGTPGVVAPARAMPSSTAGAGPSRSSPAEEEMDEDESEWAVGLVLRLLRCGENGGQLKSRMMPLVLSGRNQSASRWELGVLHEAVRQIAATTRFTVEEVQEFYDRCGEMERTRTRFEAMRALLTERFADKVWEENNV